MNFIDSHAHITSDAVFSYVDELLARARHQGISDIINICTDAPTLERGLTLSKKYPWVHTVAATTPHDVDKEGELIFPLIEKHSKKGDLVAIGETGLDYFYEHSPKELQQHFLRRYLKLALECNLPVVIHCREAFSDFFSILDSNYTSNGKHAPGVLHCFTGSVQEAKEVLDRNWFLSLSGIVTFKKSTVLREVAKIVPLDRLLIETDTPYLAPQSHRGKTNEPAFLPETAAFIAEVKGIPIQEVATATSANARTLFKLKNHGDKND